MKSAPSNRPLVRPGRRLLLGFSVGLFVVWAPLRGLALEDGILPGSGPADREMVDLTPLEEAIYDISHQGNREGDYRWADVLEARIKGGEPLPPWPDSSPPADAEPPARHLAYWCRFRENDKTSDPTPAARDKLLAAVQSNPSRLAALLRFLPQTEDAGRKIARVLEFLPPEPSENRHVHRKARVWAYRHSGFFRDSVLAEAIHADPESQEQGEHQESALTALRAREPDFSKVLLTALTFTPDRLIATRAAGMLLDPVDADLTPGWRDWLLTAAADPSVPEGAREMATGKLLAAKWKGRDQWAIRFLAEGMGVDPYWFFDDVRDARDAWIPKLTGMIRGGNRAARERSVVLLAGIAATPDSLRPLLPWLDDPGWGGEQNGYSRLGFLDSFAEVHLPEAVSRLERALSNERDGWETARVASALAFHQARETVPAMKAALKKTEGSACAAIAESIHALGGFSRDEIFEGLEHYFFTYPSADQRHTMKFNPPEERLDSRIWVGVLLGDDPPWDQEWFDRISTRVTELVPKNPRSASALLDLMLLMKKGDVSPAAAALLGARQLTAEQLQQILPRVSKPGWNPEPFRPFCGIGGATGGFAAVLAADRKTIDSILAGNDEMSLLAMLAAAPVAEHTLAWQQLIPLLDSKDGELADAAEECLSRGGQDYRQALLVHERATAVGDEIPWDPAKGKYGEYDEIVRDAMARLKLPRGPDEIFELSQSSQGGTTGNWTVLAYPDSGVAFHDARDGRSGFAKLDKARMDRFRDYVTRYRVDELPPLVQPIMDGVSFFYVHSSGDHTSRVFMNNPPGAGPWDAPSATVPTGKERYSKGIVVYGGLVNLFDDLLRELSFTWHYGETGEEVLIPREVAEFVSVWKQGDDLRALVWDRWGARFWVGVDIATRSLKGLVPPPPLAESEWYVEPYRCELKKQAPGPRASYESGPLRALQRDPQGLFWIADGQATGKLTRRGFETISKTDVFRRDPEKPERHAVVSVKGIRLDSESMWVDGTEGMIYAAANGDLVRIPAKF